jgi:hypothetical protein
LSCWSLCLLAPWRQALSRRAVSVVSAQGVQLKAMRSPTAVAPQSVTEPPTSAATQLVVGDGLSPSLPGTIHAKFSDTITLKVQTFEFLRGKDSKEFLDLLKDSDTLSPNQREAVVELAQVMRMTQTSMIRMNQAYPGLPPDTIKKTLDLVTRPGASLVLLKGKDPTDRTSTEAVHGYGIVIRGRENFPDGDHIPDRLFHGESHRLIRLFVDDVARLQLPPGEAFSRIIDTIKDISTGGPIIGMVLTDLLPLDSSLTLDPKGKAIWLEAQKALDARGFEDSGENITETIDVPGRAKVVIPFRWYVWPPISQEGARREAGHKIRFGLLDEQQRERLAGIFPSLPSEGGTVMYAGTAHDAFSVALQIPGNVVFAETFASSQKGANRVGHRSNLLSSEAKQGLLLPDGSASAVIVNGCLPDVIGNDPDPTVRNKRLEAFLRVKKASLANGGVLVVRDTLRTDLEGNVRLHFSRETAPGALSGKEIGDLFREFVATRDEKCISEDDWKNVQLLRKDEKQQVWLAPHAVAAEFLAKYRYYSDWGHERKRLYTAQSVKERIDSIVAGGPGVAPEMRLIYAGPEHSAYVDDTLVQVESLNRLPRDTYPTNHITVAQKVARGEGIGFSVGEEKPQRSNPFVSIRCFEQLDPATGEVVGYREVASREKRTLDVVPYDIQDGALLVRGRVSPRPLTVLHPALDQSVHGGYLPEQIGLLVTPDVAGDASAAKKAVEDALSKKAGVDAALPHKFQTPLQYFTGADVLDEFVLSTPVQVTGLPAGDTKIEDRHAPYGSHFRARTFNAVHFLQAQQVGQQQDARLERVIYSLLRRHCISRGPWLGEVLNLKAQDQGTLQVSHISELLNLPARKVFNEVKRKEPLVLSTHRREFTERLSGEATTGSSKEWDYVEPADHSGLSHQTVAFLPVAKVKRADGTEDIMVGLELRDLPGPQLVGHTSLLATVPSIRIPSDVTSMHVARQFTVDKFGKLFDVTVSQSKRLGGKYFKSPGITPDIEYPIIVEVDLSRSKTDTLHWVSLREMVDHIDELRCGQAITLLWRAAHMLDFQSSVRHQFSA